MLMYFNMLLANEDLTTARAKYTWLDSFSFAGGFNGLLMLFAETFFIYYNYKLNSTKILYHYELIKAKS